MRTSVLAFAAALAVTTGTAQAVTVFSDDFTGYGAGDVLSAPDSKFAGVWATTDGTVDYLAPPGGFSTSLCQPTGATNCIDLDGSTNNSGVFATVATFAAGIYTLDFGLFGSHRGTATESVTIRLGDWSWTISGISPNANVSNSITFTTTVAGSLSFENAGGDNIGALLTNVNLAAVPLPATLPLLSGGLGLVALARKRRKA